METEHTVRNEYMSHELHDLSLEFLYSWNMIRNTEETGTPYTRNCMHCRLWGAGGVGQTTLAKNLNNELLKNVPSANLSFGVVVWVTVPKPPIDIRKIQAQIASRLDLLEAINLDYVGVPQPEYPAISKVILTSCFLGVCKQMKTDTEMNIFTLKEDESWQLFVKNAGDVANLEYIQPLPKKIAKECGGFPLAITVIGTSMRGKTRVELWEDALKSLRMSEPHKQRCLEKSLHGHQVEF
ncbi:hypothetical protein BC332_20621 [Capsicum chinense]|nr:hypothetical protein BC332_20621 [Capsicum chinense]